jgi:hypothetical protein
LFPNQPWQTRRLRSHPYQLSKEKEESNSQLPPQSNLPVRSHHVVEAEWWNRNRLHTM